MTRNAIRKYLVSLRGLKLETPILIEVFRSPHKTPKICKVLSEVYEVRHLVDTKYRDTLVDTLLNMHIRSIFVETK